MPIALTNRSRNVPMIRRIEIRVQTFTRTLAKAALYLRNGHGPIEAWNKAGRTL
ncbi:MAG: hypothetical protein Q7T29_09270 [Gallionella sp.]|nr:hypothetical protein [Gallionella sp.]